MYLIIKRPIVWLCAALVLSSCSITGSSSSTGDLSPIVLFEPSKEPLTFRVSSSAKLNPDPSGRPSPLELRVYQLSGDALFKSADFYQLLDNDSEVLGRDLKKKQQMTIYPGQKSAPQSMVLDRKTAYIGLLGAFRDSDHAVSTLLIAVNPEEPAPLCLKIEAKSLVLNRSCN